MRLYFLSIFFSLSIVSVFSQAGSNGSGTQDFALDHQSLTLLEFAPFQSIAPAPENIEKELNEGFERMQEGNLKAATEIFTNVVRVEPTYFPVYYYRGVAYKTAGKFLNASMDFERLVEIKVDLFEGWIELGKTYILMKRVGQAKKCFLQAKNIRQLSPVPDYFLGILAQSVGNNSEALQHFNSSVKLDEFFPQANISLAVFYFTVLNDAEQGHAILDRVLSKDSTMIEAIFCRAIYDPLSKSQKLQDFDRLVRLAPQIPSFRFIRAQGLMYNEKYSLAYADLQWIITKSQSEELSSTLERLGANWRSDIQYAGYYTSLTIYGMPENQIDDVKKAFCLITFRKNEEALQVLNQLETCKSFPLYNYLMGLAYEEIERDDVALAYYEAALKLDPEIFDAHKKIGLHQLRTRNWGAAEESFSKALSLNPTLAILYDFKGLCRYNQGDYNGAIADFSKSLSLGSSSPEIFENRAKAYEKLNNLSLAINDYVKFYELQEWRGVEKSKLDLLINMVLQNGDTTLAISVLDRYTIDTRNLHGLEQRVFILLHQSNLDILEREITKLETDVAAGMVFLSQTRLTINHIHFIQGGAYTKLKKYDLAWDYFKKAIKFDSNNGWNYYYRAKFHLARGNKSKAIADFKLAEALGVTEAVSLLKEIKKK